MGCPVLPNGDVLTTSPRSCRRRRNLIAAVVSAVLAIGGTVVSIKVSGGSHSGTLVGTCDVGPGAQCPGADLTNADLHGSILADANLGGANLTNANLTGIYLGIIGTAVSTALPGPVSAWCVSGCGWWRGWRRCRRAVGAVRLG